MSRYEQEQILLLIDEIYRQYGRGWEREEFLANCFLAYAEIRNKIKKDYSINYWAFVAEYILSRIQEMRTARNNRYMLESKLSLNQKFEESDDEIGTALFHSYGDFTNSVVLWNYVKGLSEVKYRIMQYMAWGEDDSYIMQVMHMSEKQYHTLKMELRKDMEIFII